MTWGDGFLVISVALNVVLGIVVFFKSAANDFLSHWLKTRFIGRPEKQRDVLVELHGHVNALDRNFLIALMTVRDPPASVSETQRTIRRELDEATTFMDRRMMEFPPTIRALVVEVQKAKFLKGYPDIDRNELIRVTNAVST